MPPANRSAARGNPIGAPRAGAVRWATGVRAVITGEPSEERSRASAQLEPNGLARHSPTTSGTARACASGVVPRHSAPDASSSWPSDALGQQRRAHDLPQGLPSRRAEPPDFPAIEEAVLAYWDADDTFRASVCAPRRRRPSTSSTTARRSPTACRTTATCSPATSRTSCRGTRPCAATRWSAGSAGTPTACPPNSRRCASSASQTTDEIDEMGIEKFNEACRASVLKYTDEWRAYVTRQARWVDFDNDYKTLDPDYMESVIWAFKQLWDKGLAYEGNRVLPYCWNDETPLSSHELRMDDDVYQSRQDPAITVGLRGRGRRAGGVLPADLDDDPVDAAVQPGRRGQPRRRLRAGRGRPTGRALRAGRGPAGGLRPRTRRGAGDPRHATPGQRPARHAYLPPFPYFHGRRATPSGAAGRLRQHRGRHRHRAHVAGLRRGRHGHRPKGRHRRGHAGRPKGPLRRPVPDYAGSTCSTPTRRSSAT